MARQDNYVYLTCDRCGEDVYMQATDPKMSQWVQKERITAQDVHEKPLFCSACLKEYNNFAAEQDTAYREWMNGGAE